jgi:hypothetical protein
MSIDLERFGTIKPCLFHLTARTNLSAIRAAKTIECASVLFRRGRYNALLMVRRDSHRTIEFDSHRVLIRDQKSLHEGAIAFETGWNLSRFVQHVNEHVFFWPGSLAGPIKAGLNHYQKYAEEGLAIIRVQWWSLLRVNPQTEPLFSKFNSGAPRVVNGKHSPRGSSTYRDRHTFDGRVSDVVEVVFLNRIVLPCDTQVSPSYSGPWENLGISSK